MKKNIVFYYHNFGGLGHANRISLIIQNIINDFGGEYSIIVLNSGEKQDFLFPEDKNLKIINLPSYNIIDYKIPKSDFNNKIKLFREITINKLLSISKIESIVVEHYPFGRNFLDEEIRFFINEFKKFNDRGNVFSSVRDIFDINSIQKQNLELFDLFLIHGDEKIISYEQYFDKQTNRKIIYTGYLVNDISSDIENIEKNYILVSLGGGQDGLNGVLDFLEKLNKTTFDGKLFINLGKNYNDENIKKISDVSNFDTEIKAYFDNFLELKTQAKLVVSMGGYNNFTENLFYKKKSIIYPRTSDTEQQTRLDVFSKKVDYIYDGNKIISSDIENILTETKLKNKNMEGLNFSGAYFTASFIVNFKKYKYIKIRLTNACNAKCDMCGVIKRERKYNDIINIKKSILDFYKLGGEVVNFTGGEPTIYKGFFDLIKFSKELGLITSVSTNGSTLGEFFYKNILVNGKSLIDYIDISIDGLYELHNKIREYKGLFEIIENNIETVKNIGINLHINVTIRKDNISQMVEIFDFFKNKNIDSISFGMVSSAPLNDTSHLIPDSESLKKFYLVDKNFILSNSGAINISFSPDYNGGDFDSFVNFILKKNNFEKIQGNNCSFIKSKKEIRINENGSITPCCILDDYDENIGNINKNSLLKTICSKNYQDFLNRKFPHISTACLNCKIEI